jgi:hypothetical protein
MQQDVLAEVLEWSAKQPAWQRDALRRLFTAGGLSGTDLEDLLDLCKAGHGLSNPRAVRSLAREHVAIKEAGAAPVALISVTHHTGVNALAPEQTVGFGPSLTIVYGQNAAGKSGYTRILKRACRSRSTEEILGNVLSDDAPLKAQATLRFRVGDTEQAIAWTPDAAPTDALASVSVFDAQCAPVYLRDKTDVAFRPFGLDVFDKLSNACGELRKRLEREQRVLQTTAPQLPKVTEGTKVAALLAGLTSLTKPEQVRALAALSDEEERRHAQLREHQRDLQASNPAKRAQELELKASRVEQVAAHVAGLAALLGDTGLENVRSSGSALATARAALAHLRRTVLTPDLLRGTGEEAWRKMWDAAGEFSGVAYPGLTFPVASGDAKCVLCQQPIGADAANRFRHFSELVTSTAQADVRKAETEYGNKLSAIGRATIDREDIVIVLAEIETDDTALAKQVREFFRRSSDTKEAVARAAAGGQSPPAKGVSRSPEADLRALGRVLRERAAQLRKQTPAMDPKDAAELKELEARAALKNGLEQVLEEIERRKRIAAYGQCIEDTNTHAITRKSTELTKRLVTDRLREQFQEELAKLQFTHLAVEIKPAGGAKGALFHQLIFTNAPGVTVSRVLSEGEARALSLAAFLAELSTASGRSAIISDDPVSSLDHIWRGRIARRLVLEAKARQVIVFTHDLVFLRALLDECELQGVPFHHQYLRRDGEGCGISSPDLPWVAMRVRERIGVLRARQQAADKAFRTAGQDAYEREGREIFRLLREAWEQAIGEVLLNDVLERYRPSIETKKVRSLHDITEDDCKAVEAAMTESSRWLHDQPPADASPFPKPSELLKRIQELDDWVQRIRKRRDGKKST